MNFPWWRELTVKQPKSSKRFVPSIDVLAKTVVVLRQTPGLKQAHVKIVEFIVAIALASTKSVLSSVRRSSGTPMAPA
jgi:hypothetical protein